MTRNLSFLLIAAAAIGCAGPAPAPPPGAGTGGGEPAPAPGPPTATLPPAPWSGARLPATAVPPVYAEQWERAENRASCALLAPASPNEAVPRAATFSGGWAIAYDQPGLRSAFGVAGTGASASGYTYAGWPFSRRWADGSLAEYGPEGGTGPNQLAYLKIPGQGCLYNIWSRLGREHLEGLLANLRFVAPR